MANIWHLFMQNITTIILFQDIATIILFILKNIPLFYAPKRLRTYQSRGVNSFKAPNPSLTRFSLPEEDEIVYPGDTPTRRPAAKRSFSATEISDEIVYPGDTPTRRPAAKRSFSATEISDEFGSPKRRKVDHPPSRPSSSSLQLVPPPPGFVAQCDFAWVEAGGDDNHSPVKAQKSAVIRH
ncbi:hypothetical protein BJ166DRAFT_497363 [Pestalotiopsis sp. NC0098]|nr:hypothetical protein BJ166DRAFT_497363 [Pestalotiopsis sp. NC0098]